jgi:predicted transcriptional regulator
MTDKQAVLDAVERLPEGLSLEEITEELQIMASIRRGRADIAAGRTKTQNEARKLVRSLVPTTKVKAGKSAAAFKARLERISKKPIPGVTEVFNRVRH